MKTANCRDRILGAWLGKAIGGTLGQPYEGDLHTHELTFYDPVPTEMMPNDDLELQVLWLCKLATDWNGVVSFRNFEKTWHDCADYCCDEYGVAIRNMKLGIRAPHTGVYDNCFTDGLGGAIRSEVWACLFPGEPQKAAEYAAMDASVDHSGEGVYAEQFLTAMESAAFTEQDLRKIIGTGLSVIPPSCILANAVRDTVRWCDELKNPSAVHAEIMKKYGNENFTDVKMCLAFEVMALLLCDGDFGRAICLAVNCGYDTDCTGATVGALMGILNPFGIPEEWLAPIGRDLVISPAITGITPPKTLDELTDLLIATTPRVRMKKTPLPPFDPSAYAFPARRSILDPNGKITVPAENIMLSGNRIELDFSQIPAGHRIRLDIDFSLARAEMVNLFSCTHEFVRMEVDGEFCFESSGGPFVPGIHRMYYKQHCDKEFSAGKHLMTLFIGRHHPAVDRFPLIFGVATRRYFWMWPDPFRS